MSIFKKISVNNVSNSVYGEVSVANTFPYVSGNAVYGFIPSNFREFLAGDGTTGVVGNVFECFSGTSLGTYGTIRSFRSLNYKTGQGALIRFGALFESNEANTWSGVGAFNIGDELSFGYSGVNFGIWHRYNGKAEIQYLQITAAATGSETASVTVNGTLYSVPITSGSVQHNAYEICDYLETNGSGFRCEQVDDTIRVDFTSDGDKTNTFSFSSTGVATGTWTEITAGVTKTSVHIPMSSWDSSNGFAGFDPAKGNAYQIEWQNGYGDMKFFIAKDTTGDYELVHTIKWANNNTITNLLNPSLHVGCYATAIGTVTGVKTKMAYISGFVHGTINSTRNPRSFRNTKSIATTLTNILTIRNSRTYNGISNQIEIEPRFLSLSNDGGKTAIFELRGNPTVAGDTNFQEAGTNIVAQYDTTGGTVTENGRLLATFTVAKGQSISVDLKDLEIRIPPSLRFVIAGRMDSGAAADLSVSLTWYEDV